MQRAVPFAITFVTAFVLLWAVVVPPIDKIREEFVLFFDILAAFAFLLGGASLLGRHGRKIRRRARGWGFSAACLAAVTAEGSVLGWIYEYVFGPCDASLISLLAFYVASASFRAFRVRNAEATVMLLTAFIVLLGRTFLGGVATDWLPSQLAPLKIPNLVQWIMSVPVTAGNRAIMIGIALGIISTSLKVMLGIDRTYLGEDA
jgi:hypothetical protein